MGNALKARLERLEARLLDPEPLRLFVVTINCEPQGFAAHLPDGPTVARQPGESLEALEERCAALAPKVTIWCST